MTLPIQTIIDTHEALSDWKFTAQEANQVIASVWEGVISAIILTTMIGIFNMEVGKNPGDKNPGEKLPTPRQSNASNPRIEQARFTRKTMDALDELTSAVTKRPVDNAAELDEALTLWIKQEKGLNNLARLAKESDDYLPRLHSILGEQYGDEITVYRGGQSMRQIVSVSTDRDIAARFGDVEQFMVKTSNILAACPTLESELLVRQTALKKTALIAPVGANPAISQLGLTAREPMYIMSKPPKKPFLYHHSTYSGLKRIAEEWAIRASPGKHAVSLTTDPGRFLSPVPMLAAVTVDGVIKMPLTAELQEVTIPALYRTRSQELADKARELGYRVFTKEGLPPEYKYIMRFVVHGDMFIDENEYVVIADYVNVPTNSTIYVNPKKLKRFKAALRKFSMEDIRSLEELAAEVERE